jgi:cell division septation protein DedD
VKAEPPHREAVPTATLATPEPEAPTVPLDQALQVGAFLSRERAEAVRKQLSGRYPSVTIKPMTRDGQTLHRVRVGGFRSQQDLGLAAAALRTDGWEPMRVRP